MRQWTSDRRRFLQWLGGATAGAALGGTVRGTPRNAVEPAAIPRDAAAPAAAAPAAVAPAAAAPRKRLLRVAHLTDIHVQPERGAAEGLAACLRHLQSQPDAPSLILNTGDCIMDAMKRDRARTELQWRVWDSVWKAQCSLPVQHAIGNHDIWGWNKARSRTTGGEAAWGKKWALDALKLHKPYHSFDHGGWHFVALDSVQPFEDRYIAHLDDEQFAWLESDLAATAATTPVLVMSHIPIFSVTPLVVPNADAGDAFKVGKAAMHGDFQRIRALFKRHPNVKACVSGHIHLVDRVDYGGVSYLCDGAVSGDWWKGTRLGDCDPGYALIDLYDDGTVDRQYVTYGWVARPDEKPTEPAAAPAVPAAASSRIDAPRRPAA